MEDTIRTHTISADGKRLGRLASEIAHILLGKDMPDFTKNSVAPVHITVEHVDALDLPEAKRATKIYTRYSGHPGGLKRETLEQVIAHKGAGEALRRAVYNMLPANRLRKARMKNLIIT